jgi:iron complex outermembrane receptor protein
MKPIVLSVAATFGGIAALAGLPAPASAQQSLDRVEVTGSNIRRTDTETVSPVEIITREQIERTGKPTIADVLKSVPSNTGGAFGESFSNSFAPGASSVSLRGLGQKTTLVLLNGRRVSGYGFAQNITDTFVDLNAIPSSAVERVEILKDGASAIYGSDAIAGVVNIILRRDFKGIEAAADMGFFEGKKDYRATLVGGFGDLASQKFNVFGVLDFYKRDELLLSDTKFGETRDYRGEDGGRNFQSLTAGGTWTDVTGFNPATGRPILGTQRRAVSSCAQHGRVLDFNGAVAAGLLNPAVAANAALNQPGNTWCAVDFNSVLSAIPGTERIGGLVRGTLEVNPRVQVYGEAGVSRIKTEQTFTPPIYASTALTQTPVGLSPFAFNITFAPGVAGNPYATNARFTGNFFGVGPRTKDLTSDTLRGLAGAKWGFGNWDFDSAVGYSRNEAEDVGHKRFLLSQVGSVFNVPITPQPPEPTSAASTCNLDNQYASAGCQSLATDVTRKSTSELTFVDTKASTEIGQLPGGPVGLAIGLEHRIEKIRDEPDANAAAGNIVAQGLTATNGDRNNTAGFIEFALPLTRAIEAQIAARDDYYSDFGNAFTPKFGLKIKPSNEVLFRANWGRGFRAPTLPEISPSVATFFTTVNDPVTNINGAQVSGVFAGNPSLRPERSRSSTLGLVIAPTADFSISVDYYDIAWADVVLADCCQAIVNNDAALRAAGGAGDPRVVRDPGNLAPNGQPIIVRVEGGYRNQQRTETNGVDIDLRYALRTSVGRFSTRLNAAYVIDFDVDGIGLAGTNGDGTRTIPRWKGNWTLGYEAGPALVQATVNYIHRYEQQLLDGSFFAPGCGTQTPCPPGTTFGQTGTYPTKVPSYTTLDLYARWSITKNFELSGSILNVTDEVPPYDPGFDPTNLWDFSQYDPRGRIYRIGIKYKF